MPRSYTPPLKDIAFSMFDVVDVLGLTKDIPQYQDINQETAQMVLESARDFTLTYTLPITQKADAEGAKWENGKVTTPKDYKAGYDAYREAGFMGMTGNPTYGGMGYPSYLATAVADITCGGDLAMMMCAILTEGATKVLNEDATDAIKEKFLPIMYDGTMSCTMCLTEGGAGSSMDETKTEAVDNGDGTYDITGSKIFISFGEHDLTDNIGHLVLARLPGAPKGARGISLFLVPKKDMDTGESNGVTCTSIEEKMGIHGSPTCAMSFEAAKGWMIGEENKGLLSMFKMMNHARLGVAEQGLSIGGAARQGAAVYAQGRVQGKTITDTIMKTPNAQAVAIIEHANVLRDLVEMQAQEDAYRNLSYNISAHLSLAHYHPDETVRVNAAAYTSMMTPVSKACMTDFGCAAAQKGIQLHGGYGFVKEYGMEQLYRDVIIASIYEGTNDIQSKTFVFDPANQKTLPTFMQSVVAEVEAANKNGLNVPAAKIQEGLMLFQSTAKNITDKATAGKFDEVLADANDFTTMFGRLAMGAMQLKMLNTTSTKKPTTHFGNDFYETKKMLGQYYIQNMMLPDMKRAELRIKKPQSEISICDFKPEQVQPQ